MADIKYFTGFETGDAGEVDTLGDASIASAAARTGAWGLQQGTTQTTLAVSLNLSQIAVRTYFKYVSASSANSQIFRFRDASTNKGLTIALVSATGRVQVADVSGGGLTTITGSIVLTANVVNRIEVLYDVSAGGHVKTIINSATDVNTTHSTGISAIDAVSVRGQHGDRNQFDDFAIASAETAIGEGQVVARQGISGTPTYDAWTKNSGSGAWSVLSDTPFNSGTNISNALSSAAQTMSIWPFSTSQSGHGSQIVSSTDRINAMKIGAVGRVAIASEGSLRRRISGADTDFSVAWATSDAFRVSNPFTAGPTVLDSMEGGVVHGADVNLVNVADLWMFVDYAPSAGAVVSRPRLSLMLMGIGQ